MPLINHTTKYSAPISLPRRISIKERSTVLYYGADASVAKKVAFIHVDITEQVQVGHIVVIPWEAITNLPNL